ncbi:hypothetical protein ES708_28908 [subsurface metagenome]
MITYSKGRGRSTPSLKAGRACHGVADNTLAISIQYWSRAGLRSQVMWKWLAGAYCLYSAMVACLGVTKVWGQVGLEALRTPSATFSGRSTVTASSHTRENMPDKLL